MDYSAYCGTRDAVWRIIIDFNISSLPISVSRLCRNLGITVKQCERKPGNANDGYSTIVSGNPYIVVSNDLYAPRARFTAAHELGHIVLGHVGQYRLLNREPSPHDSPIEQAANMFAARLLAPACVLWGCQVRTADDIMRLCDVSRAAAEYRMERMRVLYERNKFLTSPLEKQVYQQFLPFIKRNRL